MQLQLNNRVAVVTGGSRGIGAATVRLLVSTGARVVFNYHKARASADALVNELGQGRCAAIQVNLDSPAAAQELVQEAVTSFGRVDIVVANHGIWPPEDLPVERMPDDHWRRTLAVNLDSVFGLVKHGVAQMKAQGSGGHIVLVSSTAGQRGEAFHVDYAATKGALISMVKGLAAELAPDRIYVNCVAPGWVHTDMTDSTLRDPVLRERVFSTIPLRRVATPEEIAGPIVFLCTPHAGFITGEVFNVNGGAVLVG